MKLYRLSRECIGYLTIDPLGNIPPLFFLLVSLISISVVLIWKEESNVSVTDKLEGHQVVRLLTNMDRGDSVIELIVSSTVLNQLLEDLR